MGRGKRRVACITTILMASSGFVAKEAEAQPTSDDTDGTAAQDGASTEGQSNDAREGRLGEAVVLRPSAVGRQQNELRHVPPAGQGVWRRLVTSERGRWQDAEAENPVLAQRRLQLDLPFGTGGRTSLEEQALVPIQAADEMNQDLDRTGEKADRRSRLRKAVPGRVRHESDS